MGNLAKQPFISKNLITFFFSFKKKSVIFKGNQPN